MSRLRQPGDSHYDVLGLSPGASDEEINSAFHQLIDQQGYKVGVPLDRQWLRAREIKAAHATLGDPAKRRAYDESLGRAPEAAPWAMAASDPATDSLVLPEEETIAPPQPENRPPPDAVVPADEDLAPVPPEPAPEAVAEPIAEEVGELEDENLARVPPEPAPEAVAEPVAEEVGALEDENLARVPPEPAPEAMAEPVAEEVGARDDGPPPPDLAPTLNDNEPSSVAALDDRKPVSGRTWAAAAVVAVGLGLVVLPSWLGWDRPSSIGEGTQRIAASKGQAGGARPGFVDQAPGNYGLAAGSSVEPQGATTAGSPTSDAVESGQATAQDVGQLATEGAADAQSRADMGSTGSQPAVPSLATQTVEPPAAAPVPTPPVASAPQIATRPAAGAERSGTMVRREPEWIGGGPTDADNRRGRYQGTVAVQVTVEADGRVSRCAPVRGSGNPGLDALTCNLVQQRARFSPALDAQGRPVASQTFTTFFWGRRPRD